MQGLYMLWSKTESWALTNKKTSRPKMPVYSCYLKIQIHKFDIAGKTFVTELGNLNPGLKKKPQTSNFCILSVPVQEQGLVLV